MSSSSPSLENQNRTKFYDQLSPLLVPPISAAVAIIPCFGDLIKKSALQKGENLPKIKIVSSLKDGLKAAPTVGMIVGSQMVFQNTLQQKLSRPQDKNNLSTIAFSSCLVGIVSAPILAIFNGQTMGLGLKETLKKLSSKQVMAISIQETAFIGGLSIADKISGIMKTNLNDHMLVDYLGAFLAGACGSLAGHPANTALTRWQSGLRLENVQQAMWGSMRKARAIGSFSVIYKIVKDSLNSRVELK